MIAIRRIGLLLRFATATVWLLTSVYALLAFVPFTYRQVLSINLIPTVQSFATLQPWICAGVSIAFVVFTLAVEKRRTVSFEDRRELLFFLACAAGLSVWNLPMHLQNNSRALFWSFICQLPAIWIGFFNLRDTPPERAHVTRHSYILLAAVAAGLFTALVSGLITGTLEIHRVLTTVTFALVGGCILSLTEQFVLSARLKLSKAFFVYSLLLSCALGSYIALQIAPAIAFFGALAWFWSFGFAIALSLTLLSTGALFSLAMNTGDSTSLKLLTRGFIPRRTEVLFLGAIAGAFVLVQRAIGTFDWNGLALKTTALTVLLMSFLVFILLAPLSKRAQVSSAKTIRLLNYGLLSILTLTLVIALRVSFKQVKGDTTPDPIFQLSRGVIFPQTETSRFFAELQSQTNLPKTRTVRLDPVNLSEKPSVAKQHPLIFFFVIDSLRRDYISTYDAAVTFTPRIGEFAADSFVFKNAFTRYGATGLSEPSLWAGQMFPHQMYPQPFDTINLLHKVVRQESYPMWISRDSILQEILPARTTEADLDLGVGTQDLDFCKTTSEIIDRLSKDPSVKPFVYTQSQNLHVSVLARTPASSAESTGMDSKFYRPYALATQRIDTCFGKFVSELKNRGFYDDSLIVLTADHGDSLGEEGRFGHAYTVFPEVMRIPLLVHVPRILQSQFTARNDLVFSTDITPTIASLLGFELPPPNWWQGRPLLMRSGETVVSPPGPHLVMSSYGPVAGLLSEKGDSIYIADAINFTNFEYQINERGSSNVGANSVSKVEGDKTLKQKIDELYSAFGL